MCREYIVFRGSSISCSLACVHEGEAGNDESAPVSTGKN